MDLRCDGRHTGTRSAKYSVHASNRSRCCLVATVGVRLVVVVVVVEMVVEPTWARVAIRTRPPCAVTTF